LPAGSIGAASTVAAGIENPFCVLNAEFWGFSRGYGQGGR